MADYSGGCLCGNVRYRISGEPTWVDFPRESAIFDGPGGEPAWFRSSPASQRGSCPTCGGAICSVDDGSDKICMTVATLDDPDPIVPESRSYPDSAPSWLRVEAVPPGKFR